MRMVWLLWLKRVRTIIFGKNPRRGGRPPRDRNRILMINMVFIGMRAFAGICLIEKMLIE